MRVGDPRRWDSVARGARVYKGNEKKFADCGKQAERKKETVACTIKIQPSAFDVIPSFSFMRDYNKSLKKKQIIKSARFTEQQITSLLKAAETGSSPATRTSSSPIVP
jgi:hypothetical protein